MPLRILADDNIADVRDAFATLGEVVAVPAREIDATRVRDADLLLVRSTVRVDAALLASSRVRFVATATAGVDHIDVDWLAHRGIAFASAAGSNANAVAQWVAQVYLKLRPDDARARVGVVGVGQVGGRVAAFFEALGHEVVRCDPPRARREGPSRFTALDDLLPSVDVLTLHAPLVAAGEDATRDLLDAGRVARLRPGALVINSARGELVDESALVTARVRDRIGALAIDTWQREPSLDLEHVAATDLATPHVAGHSIDAKRAGTQLVYHAACRWLGVSATWRRDDAPPPLDAALFAMDARSDEACLLAALTALYAIDRDDAFMRALGAQADPAQAFARYRASYSPRRELRDVAARVPAERPRLALALAALAATGSPPNK